jgi:photosystem II stability/assembly factor-like uncharacterized protein
LETVCLSPNGVDTYTLSSPPRQLLIATMDGIVWLQGDQDGAWRVTAHMLTGQHVEALMVAPETRTIFAATHGGGLHRRAATDTQFSCAGAVPRSIVFTLTWVREPQGIALYAGTEPAALFRSRDDGLSWHELPALRQVPSSARWNFPAPPHIAHVKHITADPRDSQVLYVCVEQGALLKSFDGGNSFFELAFDDASYRLNKDTHRIVFTPGNPDEIYLDGGDGITKSLDAGRTWTRIATPSMRVGYPDQLFISPENDDQIFVVGGGTAPNVWRQSGTADAAIVRSDDRGLSWSHVGGGLPDGEALKGNLEAASLVRWPGGFGLVAASSDGEVFGSFDKGGSWRLLSASLPPISKCVHHANLSIGRAKASAAI